VTSHEECRDLLAMRQDLSAEQARWLDEHLAGCRECRELAAEYARQDAFLQSLLLPAPPLTFQSGVLGRAHRRARARRVLPWRHGVALLSAVAVIVVLLLSAHAATGGRSNPGAMAPEPGTSLAPLQSGQYSVNSAGQTGRKQTGPTDGAAAAAPAYGRGDSPAIVGRPAPHESPSRAATARDGAYSALPTNGAFTTPTPDGERAVPQTSASFGRLSAATPVVLHVQSTSQGVQLILKVQGSAFAANAVIPVIVRVRNLTQHPVRVRSETVPAGCRVADPGVQSVDRHGRVVLPRLAVPSSLCTALPMQWRSGGYMPPGKVTTTRAYAVLTTRRIRAAIDVEHVSACSSNPSGRCAGRPIHITSRALTVPSTRRTLTPHVAIRFRPPATLTLVSPSNPIDRVWLSGWYRCVSTTSGAVVRDAIVPGGVGVLSSDTVALPTSACKSSSLQVRALAGYLGFPVARLDYSEPPHH
jgi:hypothetical protein